MNDALPRGLFEIPKTSGFSTTQAYSLIKICEDLHRKIVVMTDLKVERDVGAPEMVVLNPHLTEEDMFDYFFSVGPDGTEENAIETFASHFHNRTWKCWMPKREGEIPFSEAEVRAAHILSMGFDCACVPSVSVKIGPLRDMFFSKSGPMTSIMVPNSGEGFWREVFRTSGYYGAAARSFVERVM